MRDAMLSTVVHVRKILSSPVKPSMVYTKGLAKCKGDDPLAGKTNGTGCGEEKKKIWTEHPSLTGRESNLGSGKMTN